MKISAISTPVTPPGVLLDHAVPDTLVLRQNDPAPRPDDGEPIRILCVRREVVIVNLNGLACPTECLGPAPLSQRPVNEENERWN